MDPLSVAAAAASLSAFCSKAILGIRAVKASWDDAPRSLTTLATECSTLTASLVVLQTTIREEQSLIESQSSQMSYPELFGHDGTVTEALNNIICSCSMAIADLTNEIATIQRHANDSGVLNSVGRASFVFNESRLRDLTHNLHAQSGALSMLQIVLQGKSLVEIRKRMRENEPSIREACANSEKSWRLQNQNAEAPRTVAEAESILHADEMTEISKDFQLELMASPVYLRTHSRSGNIPGGWSPAEQPIEPEVEDTTSLFASIRRQDYKNVRLLLERGEDVHQVDRGGLTLLHRCAEIPEKTATRIATLLVRHGADVNSHRPNTGMTPLRWAAQRGNLTMVKILVGTGADMTIKGPLGFQAIHAAVQFGHCEVVKYLLNPDEGVENGLSILVEASLFDDRALKRDNSCNLLHFAATGNPGMDMIKLLIERGLDPMSISANSRSSLYYAIANDNPEVLQHFCKLGFSVISEILQAADNNTPAKLASLSATGIDLDSRGLDGRTAASICAEGRRSTALQNLVAEGASATLIDSSGRSPLLWAAYLCDSQAIELLASRYAPIPLDDLQFAIEHHISSSSANDEFTELLLTTLVQPLDDQLAQDILDFAIRREWLSVVLVVLKLRPTVDLKWVIRCAGSNEQYAIMERVIDAYLRDSGGAVATSLGRFTAAVESDSPEGVLWFLTLERHKSLEHRKGTGLVAQFQEFVPLEQAFNSTNVEVMLLVIHHLIDHIDAPEPNTNASTSTFHRYNILTTILLSPMTESLALTMIEFFVEEKGLEMAKLSEQGETPLIFLMAIKPGFVRLAKFLIKSGCSPDSRVVSHIPFQGGSHVLHNASALHLAILTGSAELVRLLLECGADVDALGHVVFASILDVTNINQQGESPLMTAIRSENSSQMEIISLLLDHNADVSSTDPSLLTTIYDIGLQQGFQPFINTALNLYTNKSGFSRDASPRAHRRNSRSLIQIKPLVLACLVGNMSAVKRLLEVNNDELFPRSEFGLLHIAVLANDVELAGILLEDSRVDANDITVIGGQGESLVIDPFTPLSLAAIAGFEEMVKLLLRHGACMNGYLDMSNNISPGCIPLALAARQGEISVVKILLLHGAYLKDSDISFSVSHGEAAEVLREELARRDAHATNNKRPDESSVDVFLRELAARPKLETPTDTTLAVAQSGSIHPKAPIQDSIQPPPRAQPKVQRRRSFKMRFSGVFKREATGPGLDPLLEMGLSVGPQMNLDRQLTITLHNSPIELS
ncbi:ankyrin repeat-containing domain protein [Lasiosphaeria miniovina]|uniref:Ankyrin repeat-containing domain protein n=1 Tax=Lasiosphaeria miniovina TaxID=1954250 RepID=A0AA40DVE4_9PEZI|nr:ankyrin repeat-containing domain protein [Lasiosphaeria miniovina]KAK0717784.1 ankyrin repeat-containing domain protein [Lasiosphaeria miniovina]